MNLTSQILQENRAATHKELAILFCHLICEICPVSIYLIKTRELARMVVIELYYRNVYIKDRDRNCVVNQLARLADVAPLTVRRWMDSIDFQSYAAAKNSKAR